MRVRYKYNTAYKAGMLGIDILEPGHIVRVSVRYKYNTAYKAGMLGIDILEPARTRCQDEGQIQIQYSIQSRYAWY